MTNAERTAALLTILRHVRDFCRVVGDCSDEALIVLVEHLPNEAVLEDFEAAARTFEQGAIAYRILAKIARLRRVN